MGLNIGLGDADAPDRGFELYLASLVMVLVAGLFVLGRLAARWTKRQFGMDDYTIVLSLVRSQGAGPSLIREPPINDFSRPSPSCFQLPSILVKHSSAPQK